MASKRESLILTPKTAAAGPTRGGAPALAPAIGTRCWVKWPYLVEAVVTAVSDASVRVTKEGASPHGGGGGAAWREKANSLAADLLTKRGVDVRTVDTLLHVRPVDGLVRALDGSVEKRWAADELDVPPSLALRKNPAPDPRLDPAVAAAAAAALGWPPGSRALFLGRAYYGAPAIVLPSTATAGGGSGGLHVLVSPPSATAAAAAASARRMLAAVKVQYAPSGAAARKLGVTPRALGRVTGPLFVSAGGGGRGDRVDVGLCVKHGARRLCVPDYVQPAPGDKGWLYSPALVAVLMAYKSRHPWVFAVADLDHEAPATAAAALVPGDDADAKAAAIGAAAAWLKFQPLSRRPLVSVDATVAPDAAIRALQAALPPPPQAGDAAGVRPPRGPAPGSADVELDSVAPALLLPPATRGGVVAALAGGSFAVGDRVASIKGDGIPPFGARGTVVGVHADALEVLFDAPFVGGTDLHGRADGTQGAVLAHDVCLNLSRPHAVAAAGAAAPRVVRRAAAAPAGGAAAGGGPSYAAAARSTVLLHEPTCPPEAGAKGFAGSGGGRGRAAAAAAATRAPGAPPTLAAAVAARTQSAAASAALLQKLKMGGGGAGAAPAATPASPPPAQGAALLSLLRGAQQQSGGAPAPPPPQQAAGAALLARLGGGGGGGGRNRAPAARPPPPAAPVAPDASALPSLPASLMKGLPKPAAAASPKAGAVPAPAAPPAPAPSAPQQAPPPSAPKSKGLAGLWSRLSGKGVAADAPAEPAAAPAAAPPPPPPPAAAPRPPPQQPVAAGSGEADFWAALQAKGAQ